MKPYLIPLSEARRGDVLVFERDNGVIPKVLSWLIKRFRESEWDRSEWHLAPVIGADRFMDAQFPRLAIHKISEIKVPVVCYRIFKKQPTRYSNDKFIKDHDQKPYDFLVYLWTGLWAIGIPFPRIINKTYNCWECTFDALEYWGLDIDPSDCKYPFLTDFLRFVGEL